MELNMANEQRGGSGNFANDPERATEAGKKGGERSHGGLQGQQGSFS
jgi:general stress protein YciG